MTSTANRAGERFIHLLNLDGFDKTFHVMANGEELFDGREILLQSKDGVMLPVNVDLDGRKIVYSTAEIVGVTEQSIQFRLTQPEDVIVFEGVVEVASSSDYVVEKNEGMTKIISRKHAKVNDQLTVEFEMSLKR
jgi:beta-galactosidase